MQGRPATRSCMTISGLAMIPGAGVPMPRDQPHRRPAGATVRQVCRRRRCAMLSTVSGRRADAPASPGSTKGSRPCRGAACCQSPSPALLVSWQPSAWPSPCWRSASGGPGRLPDPAAVRHRALPRRRHSSRPERRRQAGPGHCQRQCQHGERAAEHHDGGSGHARPSPPRCRSAPGRPRRPDSGRPERRRQARSRHRERQRQHVHRAAEHDANGGRHADLHRDPATVRHRAAPHLRDSGRPERRP